MSKIVSKIKPKSGFSHIVHQSFTVALPLLVYMFVQWKFIPLAVGVILLSKWRVFAVRPRHWWPNIRANGVDITVGISTLIFILESGSNNLQFVWVVVYSIWLLILKPRSGTLMIAIQALTAQVVGSTAVWLTLSDESSLVLVLATGLVSYISARHFFTSFDEPYAPLFSHTWALFSASLTWVLSHWLIFYGAISQPTLLIIVIGFGLGALYFLEQTDRLSVLLRRQFLFIMIAIVTVIIAFSDWGDKTI